MNKPMINNQGDEFFVGDVVKFCNDTIKDRTLTIETIREDGMVFKALGDEVTGLHWMGHNLRLIERPISDGFDSF